MAKPTSYEDLRTALRVQYAVLVDAFATADSSGPTDCAGWTVADLENHIAWSAQSLARIAREPVAGAATAGMNAWAQELPELSDRIDEAARSGSLSLAPQAKAVEQALEGTSEDLVVEQLTGRHTLKDAVLFRLVEAVVHGLDVAVPPDPKALGIVVRELARTLAGRHPGRTVEVRIPPYTAVQCVEGPRHTRGTPPNVVEAEPVAFVRLCTGRERWSDLVRTGRVTASGERSDLSALLPLLS